MQGLKNHRKDFGFCQSMTGNHWRTEDRSVTWSTFYFEGSFWLSYKEQTEYTKSDQ